MPQRRRALLAGLLFLAVSALAGGAALLIDPSGALLSMPLELLDGTPFRDYRVPGLLLFVLLGLGSTAVAIALAHRRRWAPIAAAGVGVLLAGWIAVQVALIGYASWLQPLYLLLAVALVLLAIPAIGNRSGPPSG